MSYFEKKGLTELRRKVLMSVHGQVLEIGPGTGVNLKYYNTQNIASLTYLDLKFKPNLLDKVQKKYPKTQLVRGNVQHLPFEDNTFDSIVFTLLFCSIDDPQKGLSEIKRVLKDNGTIHFIEHVAPENGMLKPIFNKINPTWHSLAHGCNLNRNTMLLFLKSGFDITLKGKQFNNIFIGGIGKNVLKKKVKSKFLSKPLKKHRNTSKLNFFSKK